MFKHYARLCWNHKIESEMHISAARYEMAIVIILENFYKNSKFQGNFI